MNGTKWTDAQWKAYETAKILIPVTVLESLILAAEAHSLGVKVSSEQKRRWKNDARNAMVLVDMVLVDMVKAKVEVL